jgi:hypothetical protein
MSTVEVPIPQPGSWWAYARMGAKSVEGLGFKKPRGEYAVSGDFTRFLLRAALDDGKLQRAEDLVAWVVEHHTELVAAELARREEK